MIKLDYDSIAFDTLMKRIDFIKKNPITKSIKIFQSPSLDGFHIYIIPTKELTWNEKIYYRKLFKDDGQRIVLDLLKDEQLKDVIFQLRIKKGMVFKEIFIEEIVN
tara:strand:+ start:29 stop:346 length:318 start_codon:yes stop_codon:yes gene_type:complete